MQTSDAKKFVENGGEKFLSIAVIVELMKAAHGRGAPFRFRARGYSMNPLIKDGDIITVSPIASSPLRIGDVVAFTRVNSRKLVVHRIVGKRGGSFIMQGDNVDIIDGYIPKSNILGRLVNVERDGKSLTFGLGPERILLAFLVRSRLIGSFSIRLIQKLIRLLMK